MRAKEHRWIGLGALRWHDRCIWYILFCGPEVPSKKACIISATQQVDLYAVLPLATGDWHAVLQMSFWCHHRPEHKYQEARNILTALWRKSKCGLLLKEMFAIQWNTAEWLVALIRATARNPKDSCLSSPKAAECLSSSYTYTNRTVSVQGYLLSSMFIRVFLICIHIFHNF